MLLEALELTSYTVAISTTPASVPFSVVITGVCQWYKGSASLTVDSGTSVVVNMNAVYGETYESDPGPPPVYAQRSYYFDQWDDGDKSRSRTFTVSTNLTRSVTYALQGYYPVKNPTRRASKFSAKTDHEVAGLRTSAMKPLMVSQVNVSSENQVAMETLVGNYLNSTGLGGWDMHYYRNFSQALFRLKRLFNDASLVSEAQHLKDYWTAKGLEEAKLIAIAGLLGVVVT
jgi:hypothetical protein